MPSNKALKKLRFKSKSAAYDYFDKTEGGKIYICQIENDSSDSDEVCGFKVKSSGDSSLSLHLKAHLQKHPYVFKIVERKDDILSKKKAKVIPKEKVLVSMSSEKLKSSIVDLVLLHSMPLDYFSRPPFKALIGEMAHKLGVSLEVMDISKLVEEDERMREGPRTDIEYRL